ncbi:unnamed protein product, partial [Rotaria magnacalcarata]
MFIYFLFIHRPCTILNANQTTYFQLDSMMIKRSCSKSNIPATKF